MKKITVVTQVYNSEKYLRKAIESVLSQTYSDLEYLIVDNGSTDGSAEIIKEYAEKDNRIIVKSFSENKREVRWIRVLLEMGTCEFFTECDSDDWFAPTFLERMVSIYNKTGADMVVTGNLAYFEGSDMKPAVLTRFEKPLLLSRSDFPVYYPVYHKNFRMYHAKLLKMDLLRKMSQEAFQMVSTLEFYAVDTLLMFAWLRNCGKIYLDDSLLYNYLIRANSWSRTYERTQSYSDLVAYNDAISFLESFGPISAANLNFVNVVYANAIKDTIGNMEKSPLSAEDKMREYREIIERDATYKVYHSIDSTPYGKIIGESRLNLFGAILKCAVNLSDDNEDWKAVKKNVKMICAE